MLYEYIRSDGNTHDRVSIFRRGPHLRFRFKRMDVIGAISNGAFSPVFTAVGAGGECRNDEKLFEQALVPLPRVPFCFLQAYRTSPSQTV
jgi:hypothetical protein